MNRTDRLYALEAALRAAGRRGRTAESLAEQFAVSARTIKRDVAALQGAGHPIAGQDGRGGGYQLVSIATAPLVFTGGEAAAIAIALAADPGMPFAPDGRSALAKILGAMSPKERAEVSALGRKVWMRSGAKPLGRRPARIVDEALRRGVAVTIDYTDATGKLTRRRRIEPLAFARTGGHWYLLAWCLTRNAGRSFRCDRVLRARLTRTPITPRDLRELGEPPPDAQPVVL